MARLRCTPRDLYEGSTESSVRFRYAVLAFDIVTMLFIVATSFLPTTDVTYSIDVVFGFLILADFSVGY